MTKRFIMERILANNNLRRVGFQQLLNQLQSDTLYYNLII